MSEPPPPNRDFPLTDGPACSRFILRLKPAAFAAAGSAFGAPLPEAACRASEKSGRAALWLGPDEFLLLAPEAERNTIAAAITGALSGQPHALVDVGHRQCGLILSGPRAETVLSAECPLDLHPAAFPAGMCTRTLFGKAEIVLWRQTKEVFYLEAARSFVPYLRGLLGLVAAEVE